MAKQLRTKDTYQIAEGFEFAVKDVDSMDKIKFFALLLLAANESLSALTIVNYTCRRCFIAALLDSKPSKRM